MKDAKYIKWLDNVTNILKDYPYTALIPSPPDERDFVLKSASMAVLPKRVELPKSPIDIDQEEHPHCVGAALAGIFNAHYAAIGKLPEGGFSWSWLYAKCKLEDEFSGPGTFYRVALKILLRDGFCPETFCPSGRSVEDIVLTPLMDQVASAYKIKAFYRLFTQKDIKQALADGKYVAVGTEITSTGWMDKIKENKGHLIKPSGYFLGGHATALRGYDENHVFNGEIGHNTGQNSWGPNWGAEGEYFMPFNYSLWDVAADIPEWKALSESWAIEFAEPLPIPKITLFIGNKKAIVDGNELILDQEPVINQNTGRTLVPIRFIAEALGRSVTWNPVSKRIDIY